MWLQAAVGIFLFHSICTAFILHHEPISIQPSAGSLTHQSPHSSRRTSEYCNTPAHGRQGFFQKHLLRPRRFPIQFLVTRALYHLSPRHSIHHPPPPQFCPPKRTPRSAVPRPRGRSSTWTSSPSAQYAAPFYPSATREYTHRRFTSSAVRRLSLFWNLNNNAIPLDHEQGTI